MSKKENNIKEKVEKNDKQEMVPEETTATAEAEVKEEAKKVDASEEQKGTENEGDSPEPVAEAEGAEAKEAETEAKIEKTEDDHKDKYLRLYSEFENFRRRTAKEKLDLMKTASEGLMTALLPVIDDFERALQAADEKEEIKSFKEGVDLIYKKLLNVTQGKGLKVMELKEGDDFDADFQEAIAQIPAPKEGLKGKIVDVVEKGYYLNDKVIRFAKVVIGS